MTPSGPLHRRRFIAAAALGLAGAAAGRDGPPEPPLPALGSALALAPVPLLDGGRFEPAQAQGATLVLYWWASWCPFCAEQSPHIEALWRAQRSRGLQVLALSIDRQAGAARDYLRKKGYTFPSGLLTPHLARVMPKPRGLPVTVVRGKEGTVLFAEGGQLFPEDIEGLSKYV